MSIHSTVFVLQSNMLLYLILRVVTILIRCFALHLPVKFLVYFQSIFW